VECQLDAAGNAVIQALPPGPGCDGVGFPHHTVAFVQQKPMDVCFRPERRPARPDPDVTGILPAVKALLRMTPSRSSRGGDA
jgi:hypothetical protein